ncbi:MAG TPA: hypothetical protein VFS41_04545 [Edaphobacter sp.]|nr:hypothetical protein [Edaphobacter sp.]
MDLFYQDGKFLAMVGLDRGVKYGWGKDGSISAKSDEPTIISVGTDRGDFLEVLDSKTKEVIHEGGDGQWFNVNVSSAPVCIRKKKLPVVKLTAAQRKRARKTVTRYLLSDTPYSLGIPDTVTGTIKWLGRQLAKIPAASRANATIDFSERRAYGESYANIAITFQEKETDAELDARLQAEAERKRLGEVAERAQLAALETKYAKKKRA